MHVNRVSLTSAKLKRNDNVSEREQMLYAEYEQAKKEAEDREMDRKATQDQLAHNRDSSATT